MTQETTPVDGDNAARGGRGLGGRIVRLEPLTPRSTLLRLEGPALVGFDWVPGQHVRIRIGSMREALRRFSPHDAVRAYSIWDGDAKAGWLEFVLFDHGTPDSLGLGWARRARVGQWAGFIRGRGFFRLDPAANYHLFAGEETASVPYGAMLRALPAEAAVFGVVQADTATDHLELPRPLQRIERGGASAASSQQLVDAVAALDLPTEPGVAYLAGEARTIQLIRTRLVEERGWPRRNVLTKPFWTPGKRGLE